jgi:hypothetical protein
VRGIVEPLWASECFAAEFNEFASDPHLRAVVGCRTGSADGRAHSPVLRSGILSHLHGIPLITR